MEQHLNKPGRTPELTNEMVQSWFLDPGISYPQHGPAQARNADPLFINTVGSWENRPEAATAIPNLLLAADYVRTETDLTTMEGANHAARAAVNVVLASSESNAQPAATYTPHTAPKLDAAKRIDADRYQRGQAHILDTPWPGVGISGVVEQLRSLLSKNLGLALNK